MKIGELNIEVNIARTGGRTLRPTPSTSQYPPYLLAYRDFQENKLSP